MNSIQEVILNSDLFSIIYKFSYEPKYHSVYEGGELNIHDYLDIGNEHDIVSYSANNQMGCADYEIVLDENGMKSLKCIWTPEDE